MYNVTKCHKNVRSVYNKILHEHHMPRTLTDQVHCDCAVCARCTRIQFFVIKICANGYVLARHVRHVNGDYARFPCRKYTMHMVSHHHDPGGSVIEIGNGLWGRYGSIGIGSGSVWARFAVGFGPMQNRFGVTLGSSRD